MASHCGGASNLQWTQPLSRPCQARASPFGAGVKSLVLPRRRKERAYPELVRAHRCRLVVLAVEVGGRWSDEAASFIRSLARARALEAPARLRPSVVSALVARWSAQLTHAAMTAFASSLFRQAAGPELCNAGGGTLPPSAPCWLILPTCHWRAHPACPAGEPHSREPPVYKWLPP